MDPSSQPASDGELVQAALQGQSQAFGDLYDRYFPSVYDFLQRMTRNTEEAADLAQETFLKAMENLGQLQNASRFKSWLFSIAHHGAVNRLERRKREVVPSQAAESGDGDGASDPLFQQVDPDRLANPEQAAEAQELAGLVWEAAAGLDPRTYSVLDLHLRQGLESAEIAEVLGVSKGNAYTMLNRMKKSVEEAIGTFLLARRGSKDCDELQAILAPVSIPPVTPELRRTIDRHVRRCQVCSRRRRTLLTPLEVLGAFAVVPVPVGLQEAIWGRLETKWDASQVEGVEAVSNGKPSGEYPGQRRPSDAADRQSRDMGPQDQQEAAEAVSSASSGGRGGSPPARAGGADGLLGWGDWFRRAHLRWSRRTLAMAFVGAAMLILVPVSVVLSLQWSASDSTPSGSPLSGALDGGTATVTLAQVTTAASTAEAQFADTESSTTTPAPASAMPAAGTSVPPADATPGPDGAQLGDRDGDGDGVPDALDECPQLEGVPEHDGCQPPAPSDSDGDGMPDDQDACPQVAGVPEHEGCQSLTPSDSDGDGLPDDRDACPEVAGEPEHEGCPPPAPSDSDGDGLPDDRDACPEVAGEPEREGCPPPSPQDSDGDGFENSVDRCPVRPETFNGWEDEDGCPDEVPDSDGDGYTDDVDLCPVKAETFNGWEDQDGCPDEVPDSDGDGIPDDQDACPVLPGVPEYEGCPPPPPPPPDADGDGIPDVSDLCPDEPETLNGYDDDDGCPDEG